MIMRPNRRVQLRYSTQDPKPCGTVLAVTSKDFTVRYDASRTEGGFRVPGGKFTYPVYEAGNFQEPVRGE